MKNKRVSHTPTPWSLNGQYITKPTEDGSGFRLDSIAVCNFPEQPNQANAAFLVRAVNAHEELLVTLTRVRDQLEAVIESDQKIDDVAMAMPNPALGFVYSLLEEVAQAIAKAEGPATTEGRNIDGK